MRPIDRKIKDKNYLKRLAREMNTYPSKLKPILKRNMHESTEKQVIIAISKIENREYQSHELFLDEKLVGKKERTQ